MNIIGGVRECDENLALDDLAEFEVGHNIYILVKGHGYNAWLLC